MSDETPKHTLASAVARAQGAMSNVLKDSANPHFKSRFASLAAVRDVVIPALSAEGVAVIQMPGNDEQGRVTIRTLLIHESGELDCGTIATTALVRGGNEAQALGSAVSYLRRYSLAAICGVAQEDDDGNASGSGGGRQQSRPPQRPKSAWSANEVGSLLAAAFGPADDGPPEAAQAYVHEVTKMDIPTMMASASARNAVGLALSKDARR